AYMDPDPNTKKSTIAGDDGKSIAFIDDFEGSKRTIPIGISYTGWKDLSVPDSIHVIGEDKMDQMQHKGKSYWFNHQPPFDESKWIWPEKEVTTDNSKVTVLDYLFKPGERGMYNSEPDLSDPSQSWGGMMKLLSSSANNLEEEKIEAIELWIQIINAPDDAKINIDMGQISEDVIPNSRLDTEDKNVNDLIEEGEDTGIDGLRNSEEDGYDAVTNPDPNGDDYSFVAGSVNFENINGTEGNAVLTDIGKFPDTEDLNRNGNLDRIDSYFRYTIPLSTDSTVNPFVAGGGTTVQQWYQFKIPLKDFTSKVGDPTFSVVEFVRVWFTDVSDSVHIRITDFNLVGNQWEKVIDPPRVEPDDSVLTVSTISIEDNPEYYSPPGVIRETDRTSNTGQNVKKNEQSLQLIFTELGDGDNRSVVKYVPKSMDIFNYK
ncbi:MAG: cell surface protein SprA, partial [Melioribacteraceae bacterium]|nr:cell surface protein SprA [Melioribacteraceae bacterium]